MFPQITSHLPASTVHSRLLLVSGLVTVRNQNGDLWVLSHANSFPPQSFPVRNSAFKALLHLSPGENSITLDFRCSRNSSSNQAVFDVTYVPLLQNPPLHLAILIGQDSPLRYDEVPGVPANLDTAIKKLRMAAYLWQAYTANEMHAQGHGHRTFRLEEAWLHDTLSRVDSPRRTTAKVTVLRSRHSTAHLRDPCRAQQYKGRTDDQGLYRIAAEAIREHPELKPALGEKSHVAVLYLDSMWDKKHKTVTAHAALGGPDAGGGLALAIFGSHSLFAWPDCIEDVVKAFSDTRPVDTKHCCVDGEGNNYMMAANVGIGAFLHECGHLFGCPHQPDGVMLRDYIRLNRSFTLATGELCHWNRLDTLRFLRHPCFSLPSDKSYPPGCISALPIPTGILISSPSPIVLVELRTNGSEYPTSTLEPNKPSFVIPFPPVDTNIQLFSRGCPTFTVPSSAAMVPNNGTFRTVVCGSGKGTAQRAAIPYPLTRIVVHHGAALDGLEFFSNSGNGVLFGTRGGGKAVFVMQPGEELRGFSVKCGAWVDAVYIRTNLRSSEWFGGSGGGYMDAVTPGGCRLTAVFGDVGSWVLGLGVEYVSN